MVEIAQGYSRSFPDSPAAEYIKHRGLDSIATRMGLGYVAHPATGHEKQLGRLAVPYLRPAGGDHAVTTIRFRCINETCTKHPDGTWREEEVHAEHGKYQSLPGSKPMLYNTQALIRSSPYIGLAEGSSTPPAPSWQTSHAPASPASPPGVTTSTPRSSGTRSCSASPMETAQASSSYPNSRNGSRTSSPSTSTRSTT